MSELEELKKALERLEDELFELNIRSMIDYIEYGFLICDGEPMGMCEGTVDCLELKDCKDKKCTAVVHTHGDDSTDPTVADLYSTKKMGCAYICAIGEDFERDKGFVQRVRCFRPPEDHPIFGLLDSLMEKAEKGELSEDDLIDLDYYLHMSAEKVGVPYEVVVDMPLTAFSRYESPSPHIELWRKLRELKKQGIEVVEDLRELKKQLGIIANHEEEE